MATQYDFHVLVPVVISASGNTSNAADIPSGYIVCGVELPAAWNAAVVTFQVSPDGGATFNDLYYPSGEYASPSLSAGQYFGADIVYFLGASQVKVRSGTGGTPVTQAAARTVNVVAYKVQS